MKLSMTQDVWFETELRIPEFSRTGRLTVRTAENNEDAALPEAEKYFSLKRTWKDGDEIVLNLDMNPRILWGMENPEDADSAEEWLCYMVRWFWQEKSAWRKKKGRLWTAGKKKH